MWPLRINMKWKPMISCLIFLFIIAGCSSAPMMVTVAQQERSDTPLNFELISPPYDPALQKTVNQLNKQAGVETIQNGKHTLVVITLGQRPSAGYKVQIEKVEKKGDKIVITYSEKKPQGMALSVISYPSVVVKLPKTDLPVQLLKTGQ